MFYQVDPSDREVPSHHIEPQPVIHKSRAGNSDVCSSDMIRHIRIQTVRSDKLERRVCLDRQRGDEYERLTSVI